MGCNINTIASTAKERVTYYCKTIECKNIEFATNYKPNQDADRQITNNCRNYCTYHITFDAYRVYVSCFPLVAETEEHQSWLL